MGYTTYFEGELEIKGRMSREFVEYINRFSNTRRMKRDIDKIKLIYPNWKELCFNGELGVEGEYLAIISEQFGQDEEASIENFNYPPSTQPGLWCQWVIKTNEDIKDRNIKEFTGKLVWDEGEKFYDYIEWLVYMIKNFFAPMNLELNGAFLAVGENPEDASYIITNRNKVVVYDALELDAIKEIMSKHKNNKIVAEHVANVETLPEKIYEKICKWYYE